ncbi:MAG: GTPase HflX, partial [Pseudomonadota bacterium]
IILSDTVGFISNLPTMLVAAFRATLEEVIGADLILHVRDIAHAETQAQRADVMGVLRELGLDADHADAPIIEVYNKVDLLDAEARGVLENRMAAEAAATAVLVSAETGEGLDALQALIARRITASSVARSVHVPAQDGALLAWVFENAEVLDRSVDDSGTTTLDIRIPHAKAGQLDARLKA